jgi:hypothetical protein
MPNFLKLWFHASCEIRGLIVPLAMLFLAALACSPGGQATEPPSEERATQVPTETAQDDDEPQPTDTPAGDGESDEELSFAPISEVLTISITGKENIPSDINDQIAGWLPGGGAPCVPEFPPETTEWLRSLGGAEIPAVRWQVELCVYGLTEQTSATITLPDGSVEIVPLFLEIPVGDFSLMEFIYKFNSGAQLGEYLIDVKDQQGNHLTDQFTLVIPTGPTGDWDQDLQSVRFGGFEPQEQIRVLGYSLQEGDHLGFLTERWIQADNHGFLLIMFDNYYPDVIIAIGEDSGSTWVGTGGIAWDGIESIFKDNPSTSRP